MLSSKPRGPCSHNLLVEEGQIRKERFLLYGPTLSSVLRRVFRPLLLHIRIIILGIFWRFATLLCFFTSYLLCKLWSFGILGQPSPKPAFSRPLFSDDLCSPSSSLSSLPTVASTKVTLHLPVLCTPAFLATHMATKVITFPVRGRRWCFSALAPSAPVGKPSAGVASVSQLWNRLVSLHRLSDRAELMEQFVSTKMQDKWAELGAQPSESIRHRIYSIGERLLSRIPPQEQFLKNISKDTSKVELVFPSSLNPRLVRRRVRHLGHSGTVYHRKLMYGSMALLPFTVLLGILPLPNVTFFWNLFRAHAHWRALQGSTRLQMLVTDSATQASIAKYDAERKHGEENTQHAGNAVSKSVLINGQAQPWVFVPSSELESLVKPATVMSGAISESAIAAISREFKLDSTQILSWRKAK